MPRTSVNEQGPLAIWIGFLPFVSAYIVARGEGLFTFLTFLLLQYMLIWFTNLALLLIGER
jgi:hypothetical protein